MRDSDHKAAVAAALIVATPTLGRDLVRVFRTILAKFGRFVLVKAAQTGNLGILFRSPLWAQAEAEMVAIWTDPNSRLFRGAMKAAEQTYRKSFPKAALDREALEAQVRAWLEVRGRETAAGMIRSTKQGIVNAVRLAETTTHPALLKLSVQQRRRLVLMTNSGKLRVGYSSNRAGVIWKAIEDSADQMRGRSGLTIARKAADRRLQAALRERAAVFARSEAVQAVNRGQIQAWVAGDDAGVLKGDRILRWVAGGPRPCVRCLAFHGTTRELRSGVFVSTRGEVAEQPDVHPNGFCRVTLVRRPKSKPKRGKSKRNPRSTVKPPRR